LKRHEAIETTVERARHYGAMAKDALAPFKETPLKRALLDVVDFCVSRVH
jgi:octaprenyl-diphosphate synthase